MKSREQIEKMYWELKKHEDISHKELDEERDPDVRYEILEELYCISEKASLLREILDG